MNECMTILAVAVVVQRMSLAILADDTGVTPKPVVSGEGITATTFTETTQQREARMRWFTEGRFGMFLHWGVYSVPAGEWGDKKGCGEWLMENARIEVVNLWPNRLMGDRKPPAVQRRTHTRMFMGALNNDQQPSGLLGPVTIQTTQRTNVR